MTNPKRPTLAVAPDAPSYPTILHALEAAARRIPSRVALVCEDRSLSYLEHFHAVSGLARRLQGAGVGRGDTVAVLMTNCLQMPVATLSAMAARGLAAPINPNYADRELLPLLRDAAPKAILTIPAYADRVRGFARELGVAQVTVLEETQAAIAALLAEGRDGLPQPLPEPDDEAMMFFTGGTTGLPKGAEHRHSQIAAFCRIETGIVVNAEYDKEVSLSVAPMYHIFGHHHGVVHPIYLGATHVVVKRYKPDIVLEQLQRHGVTLFAGGPAAIYVGLLAAEGMKTADLSRLKICSAGGSPCPEDLLKSWERVTGCPITEGIGMSEGAPIAQNPSQGKRKLMSVGLPAALTEIDVIDLETGTKIMPNHERGEIRVRGPQMIRRYRNRPEESAQTIRDGWVYTGDIGYFDDEGYLFVVDRKKEMIISGGYNIYPREIDEVLMNHPATQEVAAVGAPDSFRGEVVKAFVALKPGASATPEELIEYCATQLVAYKVPKQIEIVDALPKTAANKIDKLRLRGLR